MARDIIDLIARIPLPLTHLLGWLLGLPFFLLPNRHRRISRINIDLCFAEKSGPWRRWLIFKSLVETAKTIMESPRLWRTGETGALNRIREITGLAHVHEGLAHNRGVIVIAPHLGAWEMAGLYCSSLFPLTSLYRPPRQPGLEEILVAGRRAHGAKLAATDIKGVRQLVRALKNNELVAILPDQDPRDSSALFAPFFGVATNTMTLASRIAMKSGAGLVLCVAERLSWGRGFRIHFRPLDISSEAQLETHVAAINRGVESFVRHLPQQYQWSYKRFRTRPAGEAAIY